MSADEVVLELGSMLMQDPNISLHPWEHLVVVAQINELSAKVNGFAYLPNGKAIPTGPRGVSVINKFEELQRAMMESGKGSWRAAIVRMEKSSGSLSIDFEYEDPNKWLIVPATVQKMAEFLRPIAKA